MNSYIFGNSVESINSRQRIFKINSVPLFLGNVSKGFLVDNMKILNYTDMSMIFQSVMATLILLIL